MLSYFPTAYPDELFYSRCARYAEWAAYPTTRTAIKELLGKPSPTIAIDFPRPLDVFVAELPPAYQEDINHLINASTLLPFYAPFLTASRGQDLRQFMRGQKSPVRSSGVLGWLVNKSVRSPYPRLCLACAEEDQARYGESYWHRVHQIPGVFWCPVHELLLHRSTTSWADRLISADQARNGRLVPVEDIQPQERRALLQYAKDTAWVLGNVDLPCDPDAIQKRYASLLADRQLGSFSGQIWEATLLKALHDFYPTSLLNRFNCQTLRAQQPSPFIKLARPFRHAQHPAYHLLFMQFLGIEASRFWDIPPSPGPFGTRPWPCLNPAAQHYQECVVQTCHIRSSNTDGRPIGTFRCRCGFAYQRIGPDRGPLDRYTSTTVVREHCIHVQQNQMSRLDAARSEWLRTLQHSADPKQPSAKHLAPQVYHWLHRHDRAWLQVHRPVYRTRTVRRPRVDWHLRDNLMCRAITQAAEHLLHQPDRPVRLTPKRILREAQQLVQIRISLSHMPKCANALKELHEDPQAFACRRIDWARSHFCRENRMPTRSEFMSRTGLGCWIYNVPQIMKRVTQTVDELCYLPLSNLRGS